MIRNLDDLDEGTLSKGKHQFDEICHVSGCFRFQFSQQLLSLVLSYTGSWSSSRGELIQGPNKGWGFTACESTMGINPQKCQDLDQLNILINGQVDE